MGGRREKRHFWGECLGLGSWDELEDLALISQTSGTGIIALDPKALGVLRYPEKAPTITPDTQLALSKCEMVLSIVIMTGHLSASGKQHL